MFLVTYVLYDFQFAYLNMYSIATADSFKVKDDIKAIKMKNTTIKTSLLFLESEWISYPSFRNTGHSICLLLFLLYVTSATRGLGAAVRRFLFQ